MKLLDLLSSEWAIIPERLNEIKSIIKSHQQGEKLNLKEIEARIMSLDDTASDPLMAIEDGVAVIEMSGVLVKRASAFERIFFGSMGTQDIKDAFIEAVNDPSVKGIIMSIDSPGGTVDGTMEFAGTIFENRGKKPVYVITDGTIASAAYWIAAACDAVFITSGTNQVGSIGVVATHVSYEKALNAAGISVSEIYAGKYKQLVSDSKDLTPEGKDMIQEKVDYIYSLFVDEVARFRGVPVDTVLANMADGRVFIGKQAIDAGLVDGVSSMDGVKEKILKEKNMLITKEILAKDFPDIFEAVKEEGKAEAIKDQGSDTQNDVENARKAELERIKSVKAQLMPGHEALIEELMFDGKTTGEQAAVRVLQAEKTKLEELKAKMAADEINPLNGVEPPAPKPSVKSGEKGEMTDEEIKATWDKDAEIRKEFGANFESYKAYLVNKHNIRIKGGK